MKIAGIVLIILGALALAYQGIFYTIKEKPVDIKPIEVTTTQKKSIPLPPIAGGVAFTAGIALSLAERRKK